MKKAKKLTLQKKTIRELTTTELGSVAGGLTLLVGPNACIHSQPGTGPCGTFAPGSCGDTSFTICG